MIERSDTVRVDAGPQVATAAPSPREALVAGYAAQLLQTFRALNFVTGDVVTFLENGGDPQLFLARLADFEVLVHDAGGAMAGLGAVMTSDGTA